MWLPERTLHIKCLLVAHPLGVYEQRSIKKSTRACTKAAMHGTKRKGRGGNLLRGLGLGHPCSSSRIDLLVEEVNYVQEDMDRPWWPLVGQNACHAHHMRAISWP